MAGCFGNHPFDRAMESQLMRHLDEECRLDNLMDGCDSSNCKGECIQCESEDEIMQHRADIDFLCTEEELNEGR